MRSPSLWFATKNESSPLAAEYYHRDHFSDTAHNGLCCFTVESPNIVTAQRNGSALENICTCAVHTAA